MEDVLRSAFGRMAALKEEMDALTARMAVGESDERILRRYGDLTARFEGLGGWDTDTAVDKVANGLSISREMRTRLFDALSGGEKTRVNLGHLSLHPRPRRHDERLFQERGHDGLAHGLSGRAQGDLRRGL